MHKCSPKCYFTNDWLQEEDEKKKECQITKKQGTTQHLCWLQMTKCAPFASGCDSLMKKQHRPCWECTVQTEWLGNLRQTSAETHSVSTGYSIQNRLTWRQRPRQASSQIPPHKTYGDGAFTNIGIFDTKTSTTEINCDSMPIIF